MIGCLAEEDISDEPSIADPPTKLDSSLRRALLRALTELENEENDKLSSQEPNDKIVTKAKASAVTILTSSEETKNEETQESTTEVEKNEVIVQKSNGVQTKLITTIENQDLDPIGEAENFLTSASNSFSPQNNKVLHEKTEDIKTSDVNNRINTIEQVDITTTTATKRPTVETTTATTTTTSTEESEAKAEEIQFINAPLVAAFTVHQDERGLPKRVEPIYKPTSNSRKVTATELKIIEQAKLRQEAIIKQQVAEQQRIRQQYELQQKQKVLEQEIQRLKQIQQQQEIFLRQQLQREKLLEEEIRLRNSGLPFIPVGKTHISNQIIQSTQQKPAQLTSAKKEVVTSETKEAVKTKTDSITLQPSISFDPVVEAGKLPINGQVLPVRNAVNFHQPIIQTSTFEQYHSLAPGIPNIVTLRNFQPILVEPDVSAFTTPRSNRVFRQESDTGNFFNRNVNNLGGSSFSIQKSVQPPPFQQENRFLKSNLQSTFSVPSTFSIVPSVEQSSSYNFNAFNQQPIHHNRFFRSNYDNHQIISNNYQPHNSQTVHGRLNNLIYNSGLVRNNEQQENLGVVSKVLSLNHDSFFAGSNPIPQTIQPPPRKA